MEFTPTTAGTLAQITAILLLAVAFAPEYRGTLTRKVIFDEDRNPHSVPAQTAVPRFIAVYRLAAVAVAVATIVADFYLISVDMTLTGLWAGILVVANGFNGATLASLVFGSALYHYGDRVRDPKKHS